MLHLFPEKAPENATPEAPQARVAAIRDSLWIDLHAPTAEETALIEQAAGITLPTWAAISEIEPSSRIHAVDGAMVMNLQLVSGVDSGRPAVAHASLILTADQFITIRKEDSYSFRALREALARQPHDDGAVRLLLRLLDQIVDRSADILESTGERLDQLSAAIFQFEEGDNLRLSTAELRSILKGIGRVQFLLNKIFESLATQLRVVSSLSASDTQGDRPFRLDREAKAALESLSHDIKSLSSHSSYLIETANFLLDAIVGRISIEQNAVMTVFSVVAVVFLPPTLIATIYGMNFRDMPELALPYAYPLALAVMLLSAVLPYLWFKKKGWL